MCIRDSAFPAHRSDELREDLAQRFRQHMETQGLPEDMQISEFLGLVPQDGRGVSWDVGVGEGSWAGSWEFGSELGELGAGSWELGVRGRELGAGSWGSG
eukprot:1715491-Alexandrium_andersonii.AAC.1